MYTSAEGPQRFTSPPVEPTVPHSRSFSKATVTSANLASACETNLAMPAGNFTARDKPVPLNSSTPLRRPSFMESQQQPTPRGSLQWPSTHRSFSSAAVTRDSSRHSQAADRVNLSTVVGARGRLPSSTCHTPMSSRDDGHSEYHSSVISCTGGMRRGRSLGSHPAAPPLVDVSEGSPSQSPQSASHSVCTTGLCTPRDNAPAMHTGIRGGRHPSPFSVHAVGATVDGPRSAVRPAPPPLDDFEAEAQSLSREELEERVEQMRGDNLVLRTSVLRLREALATLKDGLRSNYSDIERRQDSIANMLLRRLEATKRHRTKLAAHLRRVELEKASQEMKLRNTKQSINDLTKHLKREEQEIAERLQGRLEKLHTQCKQLDKVLEEQTSSLQQLEQLVQEVEEMGIGDGMEGSASQSAMQGTAVAAVNPAAAINVSSTLTTAGTPISDATNFSTPNNTVVATPATPAAAKASTTDASAVAPVPLQLLQLNNSSIAAPTFHERSSSRVSASSSTAGTTTVTTADVAYDPNAMIRYLEEEIAAAESLRSDALNKADQYVATRERLERRLKREKERKAEQESRTEALRQELQSASSAVNEKVASQETALEMEVDRHLNSSRFGGDVISSASSACATPKLRVVSAAVSRGNSISRSAGGGLRNGVPGGAAEGDTTTRGGGIFASTADGFLLPSSSLSSGAVPGAASSSGGYAEVPGTTASSAMTCPIGMVVGDGSTAAAVPHVSSSSMRINNSISRDETTASSEGTPHTTRLLVQETSRMVAPRPLTSAEGTPHRTPLAAPQLNVSHAPAA